MQISFSKYHGAGNDFIIIDNRTGLFSSLTANTIVGLCHRHFGIGADGLILLENPVGQEDFTMRYYNADGYEGSMCGNGGRCIAAFAHRTITAKREYVFRAIDGIHSAEILTTNDNNYLIRLQMADVTQVEKRGNDYFLNTGSPHLVRFVNDIENLNFISDARALRYDPQCTGDDGANINFVQQMSQGWLVRTYERGVEDETLACGTGNVATAIAIQYAQQSLVDGQTCHVELQARGGRLKVDFAYRNGIITDVFLCGEACFVFDGNAFPISTLPAEGMGDRQRFFMLNAKE
ncbi:MAG: diaminopimelate epimerase [Prevotellaceae bacterium]|jgi:diaminopimelate epimerase|nr:diaminopimelate epimerase [Prevotellaceae bacterium]